MVAAMVGAASQDDGAALATSSATALKFSLHHQDGKVHELSLTPGEVIYIGRAGWSAVIVEDASVSATHVELSTSGTPGEMVLHARDRSRNGTGLLTSNLSTEPVKVSAVSAVEVKDGAELIVPLRRGRNAPVSEDHLRARFLVQIGNSGSQIAPREQVGGALPSSAVPAPRRASLELAEMPLPAPLFSVTAPPPVDLAGLPDMYDPITGKGRWRYGNRLGEGGLAVVYRARDMCGSLGEVAVKVLKRHSKTPQRDARHAFAMYRESQWSIRWLHEQQHPGYEPESAALFARYLEDHTGFEQAGPASFDEKRRAFEAPDLNWNRDGPNLPPRPYVVMELVRGESLQNAIDRERRTHSPDEPPPLSLAEKRSVLEDAANALDYLTRFKLIHRDFRGCNMHLISRAGQGDTRCRLKVLDLGVMICADSVAQETSVNQAVQAFRRRGDTEEKRKRYDWLPWEVRDGENEDGPAVNFALPCYSFDMFSLAVLIMHLLTGKTTARVNLETFRHGLGGLPDASPLGVSAELMTRMLRKPPGRPSPKGLLDAMVNFDTDMLSETPCVNAAAMFEAALHKEALEEVRTTAPLANGASAQKSVVPDVAAVEDPLEDNRITTPVSSEVREECAPAADAENKFATLSGLRPQTKRPSPTAATAMTAAPALSTAKVAKQDVDSPTSPANGVVDRDMEAINQRRMNMPGSLDIDMTSQVDKQSAPLNTAKKARTNDGGSAPTSPTKMVESSPHKHKIIEIDGPTVIDLNLDAGNSKVNAAHSTRGIADPPHARAKAKASTSNSAVLAAPAALVRGANITPDEELERMLKAPPKIDKPAPKARSRSRSRPRESHQDQCNENESQRKQRERRERWAEKQRMDKEKELGHERSRADSEHKADVSSGNSSGGQVAPTVLSGITPEAHAALVLMKAEVHAALQQQATSTALSSQSSIPSAKLAQCCPKGHTLVARAAEVGICDGCEREVAHGDIVLDCSACDWYLCNVCTPSVHSRQLLEASSAKGSAEQTMPQQVLPMQVVHGLTTFNNGYGLQLPPQVASLPQNPLDNQYAGSPPSLQISLPATAPILPVPQPPPPPIRSQDAGGYESSAPCSAPPESNGDGTYGARAANGSRPSGPKRYHGKIKRVDGNKGFGFIESEDFRKDVFLLKSELRDLKIDDLQVGTEVSFAVETTAKGDQARDVTAATTAAATGSFDDRYKEVVASTTRTKSAGGPPSSTPHQQGWDSWDSWENRSKVSPPPPRAANVVPVNGDGVQLRSKTGMPLPPSNYERGQTESKTSYERGQAGWNASYDYRTNSNGW